MEESGHGVVVAASTSTVGDQNNIKSQEVDNNNNAKPMLAINMDARYFSGIRRSHIIKHKEGYKQKYDKVLCDVPCSGDGTTRKNKQIWNTWSMGHAMSLHRLQRRILRRGLEFLRPRGTLVYSTCSLNPLEDEAVVVSVINDVGGIDAVEILPLPTWLVQKCQSLNGLETWLVPHPQFGKKGLDEMYQSFDDIPIEHQGGGTKEKGEKKNKKKGGQISRTMFPPATNDSLKSQLGNCGRFIPNNSLDSGGFFVAVFVD
jgi:16S rRNA C967 or C1407 C5-methylase (RsmB/RsmF family)